ncbi:uncharacterized protein LOC129892764 [Solanum dulcamara]|uniref:uncharacterized protein LOC129892764 n=1 Tax=Solanum dulcamara TaxID=45834 RepID=UPI0024851A48|nr:uncharacterized protein LOC129892764 [Solanum dulcamara]
MCIISDRHASIIKATSNVYDEIPYFACIWHLLQNIMKNFRKSQQKVTELFYSMAKTYTTVEFNQHMEIIEKINKRIKDYLLNIGYNKWSRVHAQVNRTWMMTSNIAESVNSRTRHAKVLTVLHLLEFMRQLVQKWNNNNRSKAIFSGFYLGKKYKKILQRNKTALEKLRVRETNEYVYTVFDGITRFTREFIVDIPVSLEFPPDESTWNIPTHVLEEVVLPPLGKRPPGRPKYKRHTQLREDGFKKSKITCSNCGQQNHNRKTCKNVRPLN